MIKAVKTGIPAPSSPIEWATMADGVLYTAQIPIKMDGTIESGDIRTQTRLTLDNLKRTIAAAGGTLSNVAQVLVYLPHATDFPGMNEIYGQYFAAALSQSSHHCCSTHGARRSHRDRRLCSHRQAEATRSRGPERVAQGCPQDIPQAQITMKIAVLGAGIVGITTAYQLTRDGHDVIVVDRQADVSLECSYANGGFIAISQAVPWSSPGVLLRVLTTMFRSDAPILLHPSQLPKIWRWGLEFLSCSSAQISWENTKQILSLALYSLDLLRKVREETNIDYFQRTNGCLKIYADQHSFDESAKDAGSADPARFRLQSA